MRKENGEKRKFILRMLFVLSLAPVRIFSRGSRSTSAGMYGGSRINCFQVEGGFTNFPKNQWKITVYQHNFSLFAKFFSWERNHSKI